MSHWPFATPPLKKRSGVYLLLTGPYILPWEQSLVSQAALKLMLRHRSASILNIVLQLVIGRLSSWYGESAFACRSFRTLFYKCLQIQIWEQRWRSSRSLKTVSPKTRVFIHTRLGICSKSDFLYTKVKLASFCAAWVSLKKMYTLKIAIFWRYRRGLQH